MDNYETLKAEYEVNRDRFFEMETVGGALDKIKSDTERESIINFVFGGASEEEIRTLVQSYGLEYEATMLDILNSKIPNDIKFIDELITDIDKIISLNGNFDEEAEALTILYQEFMEKFNKYAELYRKMHKVSAKQYQEGENVIVFFRRSDDAKFLVEEDIETKCNTNNDAVQNRVFCAEKIFTAINSIPSYSFKQKRLNNFVTEITTGDHASDRQYLIKSDYSGIDCNFSRLKTPVQRGGIDNTFRMSFIKITMPQENVDKIGAKSRMVLLIIGAADIKNHNTNSEYSEFISEYETYSKEIQATIRMLEDPNTPQDELLKLLDDSSDLYNLFIETAKTKKQ